MRVSTKGQITLPFDLRKRAGILPGSEVECVEEQGRIYIRLIRRGRRGRDLVKRMAGQGATKLSTDEILALTRGDV